MKVMEFAQRDLQKLFSSRMEMPSGTVMIEEIECALDPDTMTMKMDYGRTLDDDRNDPTD
jgi:hypothetical protein